MKETEAASKVSEKEHYQTRLDGKEYGTDRDGQEDQVNREYKDRLFKFLFGNPENKKWTLELYNAINGTDYKDPDAIHFNTIGDFLYLKMRNDASFIINFSLNLWEHQSTYNPNMPMRFLMYITRLYEKYIMESDYYEYSPMLQKIPRPVCVCFYNGTADQPERKVLKLSDSYDGEGDVEVSVTMLNINLGKNRKIMEACKPLAEYAWLVDEIRRNQKRGMSLEAAVDKAVKSIPEEFVIRPFIMANRAEVKTMLFTEYDEEMIRKYDRIDAKREGIEEGKEIGAEESRIEIVKEMLTAHEPLEKIMNYSKLSAEKIRKIAKEQNIAIC